ARGCAWPSAVPSRSLFGKAGLGSAAFEFGHYIVEADARGLEHHQQVIEHVAGLGSEAALVAGDRGYHRLGGLFAQLLGALVDALGKQARGVALVGRGLGARGDALVQVFERKSHQKSPRSLRTAMPFRARCAFASPMVKVPKWKMEAARTADACPCFTPSTRWSSVPTPPEAMTGTCTASAMVRVSSRSKPDLVPSRSIEVTNSSPAPRSTILAANSTASSLVGLWPPWV